MLLRKLRSTRRSRPRPEVPHFLPAALIGEPAVCHNDHDATSTMSEERYSPSSWDHADSDTHHSSQAHNGYGRMPPSQVHHVTSGESLRLNGAAPQTPTKSSSPPRSSAESQSRPQGLRWRDSTQLPAAAEIQDTATVDSSTLVDSGFDENVLRALCDMDVRIYVAYVHHSFLTGLCWVSSAVYPCFSTE